MFAKHGEGKSKQTIVFCFFDHLVCKSRLAARPVCYSSERFDISFVSFILCLHVLLHTYLTAL